MIGRQLIAIKSSLYIFLKTASFDYRVGHRMTYTPAAEGFNLAELASEGLVLQKIKPAL